MTKLALSTLQLYPCQLLRFPAGEQHKNLATVSTIYDEMLALGLDRKATLLALGWWGRGRCGWLCGRLLYARHWFLCNAPPRFWLW